MEVLEKPLDQLQALLKHEENNPLSFIKVKHDKSQADILFFVNIYYCCHNSGGWGPPKSGTVEENGQKVLDRIKIKEAVLIFAKYDTLAKFKGAFSREMHWINQNGTRIQRFNDFSKVMFDHVKELVDKAGGLEQYTEKHISALIKMLPVTPQQITLEGLTKTEILEAIQAGTVDVPKALALINKLDREEAERNRDKLCPFSGTDDSPPRRICSWTDDPKKLGDCGSCRVAAEWEECYG